MRDRVIAQLKGAFGDPTDNEQGRWSFPREKRYPLSIVVSKLPDGHARAIKVWIFDPHCTSDDKIKILEVAGDEQIDALIQCVKHRLQPNGEA